MRLETNRHAVLCFILSYYFSIVFCKQYTLNVPRVLLPYVPASGVKSNFTLKSEHGCFTWMSTKPDVATVDPIFITGRNGNKCSREAVLTPQSTTSTRLSTIIIATEEATSLTLRSDVYVDTIYRIEITTRTRELLLEEEPEKFEVRAFDDEGNMFSTVRGHIFGWTLLRDEEAEHQQLDPDSILSFVQFQDSAYSTDPIIGQLEDQDLQGDEVLVSGVNTGTARVQVRLVENAWNDVPPDIVKLLVIENLMLLPSADVYIMPLSFVDYHIERRKHGKVEVVQMPSDQYTLELSNTTVASLDKEMSRVTGMILGDTEIVLHDKNMLNIPHATKPSAEIHVVFPHHIGFHVSPGHIWVLEVGRGYIFTVNLLDRNNHKSVITENVLLITLISTDFFEIYFSSSNESYHHVKAMKPGKTSLTSSIENLKHPETGEKHPLSNPLTKTQSIEIYDPIIVYPKRLVLLWDTKGENYYQHSMKVFGGSGNYQWNSNALDVVGVSRIGVVTSISPGKANVTVSDIRNNDHNDEAIVYVVPPSGLSFVACRVEVVVGQKLLLPLQVLGHTLEDIPTSLPFYDCRFMKLNLALSDDAIFNVTMDTNTDLSTLPDGACTFLHASAIKPGHTKLTVIYQHGSVHLETYITIASYPPLQPIDPEKVAVVTLGASKTVLLEGGPSAWVLDQSSFHKSLSSEHSTYVSITSLPSPTLTQHTYRVVCRKLGEQKLTFLIGNGPTSNNPMPANETTSINISCALPVSMLVRPVVKEMTDCPLLRGAGQGNQDVQFPVHNSAPLQLEVTVYDSERRQFDNFSSLHWDWSSSDPSLLSINSKTKIEHFGNKAILTVQLSRKSGSVTITTSSDSHVTKILQQESVVFKDPFSPKVDYSLSLLLKSEPQVSPNDLLVYNHPNNRATLTILHGSSHFRVDHVIKPRPPVADVEYIKDTQNINISPLGEGQIRITIQDLCLPVADVTAVVYVATIHSIQVNVPDKVQVGNTIVAYVRLLDNRDVPFPSDQHWLMKLQASPKTEHIEVKPSFMPTIPSYEAAVSSVYKVEGVTMGTALLLFNATMTTGKTVSSWPAEIQVFDALRLDPKNITLIPTATFQIRSFGGPLQQTSILYTINNITVATVEQSGLITAVTPGHAVVTGQAQSHDLTAGSSLIYSSDIVNVKVIKLTGIKIFVPSTKLIAGEEIAVYVEGIDDDTPFSFASSTPEFVFHWSVSNMDVLSLVSVYDKAGISLQEERDFPARLRTRNPGQGIIRVNMKCPTGLCIPNEGTFTDQIQIHVFAPLKLIHPSDGHLLLPQNGNTRIETNRDGTTHITYTLLQTCSQVGQSVISLGPNGEIRTAGFNGHAVVMVTADELDVGLNQSVTVHVEVRPIASLSLSPISPATATPHSKQHAFPLGYSAYFSANLHDSVGRQFDYAGIDLSYRLNRFDIVHITRGIGDESYIIKAAKQGNVILKVWVSDQSSICDYIRVRVGYAIIPSLATVHLGARICFTTHLTEEEHPDTWSTGGEGVLELDADTGVATASATGRAVVYHKVEGVVDTLTEISVATMQSVVFNLSSFTTSTSSSSSSSLPTFTNAKRQEEIGRYFIPVEFKDEQNNTDFTALTTSPSKACLLSSDLKDQNSLYTAFLQQVDFQCFLELENAGSPVISSKFVRAEPFFDLATGNSFCELLPTSDNRALETLSTMERLKLTLKVKASDFKGTYELWSSGLEIPFLPAFYIDISDTLLTQTKPSSEVKVTGLTKILNSIQASSPYPLTINHHTVTGTTAIFIISLTDTKSPPTQNFTDIRVTLISTITHQKLVILVSYTGITEFPESLQCPTPTDDLHGDEESFGYLDNDQWNLLFAAVACAILLLATIVVCLALRQTSNKPKGGFAAQLPPSVQPQSPAFSAPKTSSTPTSSQVGTPLWSKSGSQSAFKRHGNYSQFSPNRTSPQHNLFTQ